MTKQLLFLACLLGLHVPQAAAMSRVKGSVGINAPAARARGVRR
jgi:hypothetical protein